MFSLGVGLYQQYLSSTQINILVIGIQGAGKTTVMERLKVTDFGPSSSSSLSSAVTDHSLHHQQHHHNMTETLRSKIFSRHHPDDYKPRKRRRGPQRLNHGETRPRSRFGWICPPPPKYVMKSVLATSAGLLGMTDASTISPMIQSLNNLSDRDLMNRSSDIIFIDDELYDEIDLDNANGGKNNDDEATTEESHTTNMNNKPQRAFRRGASSVTAATTVSTTTTTTTSSAAIAKQRHLIPEHGETTTTTTTSTGLIKSQGSADTTDDAGDEAAAAEDETYLEFDLLAGKTMLPLEKIRPTIGMNLANLFVAKSTVHIWDLGGRLVDLWERYYNDTDAVLFVWKLSSSSSSSGSSGDELERQRSIFQTVRASVDCPILVLGNLMQTQPPIHCEPDVLYATDTILVHDHNNNNSTSSTVLVQFANGATGEGLKSALEWLVVRAKQAQKQRKPS
jgi:ADP-ribosylation factor related protein 1